VNADEKLPWAGKTPSTLLDIEQRGAAQAMPRSASRRQAGEFAFASCWFFQGIEEWEPWTFADLYI
jgi:hypothetical protein